MSTRRFVRSFRQAELRFERSAAVLCTLLLASISSTCTAQADEEHVRVFAATSVHPRFDDGPSIGPDARTLRYEYAERWRAGVGGELALVGVHGPLGAVAFTLGGLLALDNEDDQVPVPYQMLRAVIGVSVRAATVRRTIAPGHRYRVSLQLAYTHESDHPSGDSSTARALGRYVGLDDFSSFEHVRLGAHYEHWYGERLWFSFGGALRGYPTPINPLAGREQTAAFEVELRLRLKIHEALSIFAAFYAEGIGHELDPARVGRATLPGLFIVVRGEAGLSFATETVGRLDLYIGAVEQDGRGIDFLQHYGPSFIVGLRAML